MDARTALEVLSWIDGKYPSESGRTITGERIHLEQKWVTGPAVVGGEECYYIDGRFTVAELQAIAKYATNPAEVCAARKLSERNGSAVEKLSDKSGEKSSHTSFPAGQPERKTTLVNRIIANAKSSDFLESLSEYRTAANVGGDEKLSSILAFAADCAKLFQGNCQTFATCDFYEVSDCDMLKVAKVAEVVGQ
jgi:hypothetical protein